MELPKPHFPSNPLLSFSSFLHQHCLRLGSELASRIDETKRLAGLAVRTLPQAPAANFRHRPSADSALNPLFASVSQPKQLPPATAALSSVQVARALVGTSVYTVSNTNNEFVLISDPSGVKSVGLLCFREEDAEAFLAQARLRRRELKSDAKVVPITLDQVYSLKVEGIAFRFLPDPLQIKNALEVIKSSDRKSGFDGVPIFQSDLLVVKKKNKRYCPVYFNKEDIEKELLKTRAARGADPKIMVGSLEDVLKKMEMSEKNSGWEDLIFIPPGKNYTQHIQEVVSK